VKALRSRTDIRGRIKAFFDSAQGWILSALVGFLTATIAYVVDVSEAPVFDWKEGYCSSSFFISEKVSYLSFCAVHIYRGHTLLHASFLSCP
jgi:chloride channel 3/4/5